MYDPQDPFTKLALRTKGDRSSVLDGYLAPATIVAEAYVQREVEGEYRYQRLTSEVDRSAPIRPTGEGQQRDSQIPWGDVTLYLFVTGTLGRRIFDMPRWSELGVRPAFYLWSGDDDSEVIIGIPSAIVFEVLLQQIQEWVEDLGVAAEMFPWISVESLIIVT